MRRRTARRRAATLVACVLTGLVVCLTLAGAVSADPITIRVVVPNGVETEPGPSPSEPAPGPEPPPAPEPAPEPAPQPRPEPVPVAQPAPDPLPRTGADVAPLVLAALTALVAGAALVRHRPGTTYPSSNKERHS